MMVFISHSSRDLSFAMQIVAALEAADVRCWIAPRDISAGADYNHSIMTAIASCGAMALVYSRHSIESDPVKREIERGLHHRVPVIPIRLDQTAPSPAMEFMISTSQWVDAYPPPLERHLDTVVGAVKAALNLVHEAPKSDPDAPPQYIGPYRILEKLGDGGMGVVYKAEQRSPVKRTVAIKVIRAGLSTQEVLARFDAERQALARMNHPNVARVIDAGADARGNPFFAMEFVPGVPITKFADDNKLSIQDRLILFIQACDAISHAHTKSLLHRDIKPSNVLAYLDDGKPIVKVIDFGIAKALTTDRLTDRTFSTERGMAIGTFESMSPEQADGSPDIDTRTDVYSLGVLLYELLTGAKPFEEQTLKQAADHEIRRMIREVDPPRPSTRLSKLGELAKQVAAARQQQVESLTKQFRDELEWIPLMAMRKERDRRYPTPLALAADIQNYLDTKPLVAAPDAVGYRLKKLVRRNRRPIIAITAAFLILVCGVVGTSIGLVGQARARAEAEKERGIAQQERSEAEAQRNRAEERGREATAQGMQAQVNEAVAMTSTGDALFEAGRLGRATATYVDSFNELRRLNVSTTLTELGFLKIWRSLAAPINVIPMSGWSGRRGGGSELAFSNDGRYLAVGNASGTIELRDVATLGLVAELVGPKLIVSDVAFSSDNKWLLAGYAPNDVGAGEARLWDVASHNIVEDFTKLGPVSSVAISPDLSTLAIGTWSNPSLSIWDLHSHQWKSIEAAQLGVTCLRYSNDGQRLTAHHWHQSEPTDRVWDVKTGNELSRHLAQSWTVSSDIIRVPAGGDGQVLFNFRTNESTPIQNPVDLTGEAFSPDGRWYFGTDANGRVHLWETSTGKRAGSLIASNRSSMECAMDATGNLVAGFCGSTLFLWNRTITPGVTRYAAGIGAICSIAWQPKGQLLAVGSVDGQVALLDAATGKVFWKHAGHTGAATVLTLSDDGNELFSGGDDAVLKTWDTAKGTEERVFDCTAPVRCLSVSPDGQWVAMGAWKEKGGAGPLRVWNAKTGVERPLLEGKNSFPAALVFSQDGKKLSEGRLFGGLVVTYDLETKKPVRKSPIDLPVPDVELSGDAKYAIFQSRLVNLELDVPDVDLGANFDRHAFSPDGDRFASLSEAEREIHISQLPTAAELGSFKLESVPQSNFIFSPDGSKLVFGTSDGQVEIWDLAAPSRGWPMLEAVEGKEKTSQESESSRMLRLGQWYASVGANPWAYKLLVQSRASGEKVAPLDIARCAWKIGEWTAARENFENALSASKDPIDQHYLQMCIKAVQADAVRPVDASKK